VVTAIPSTIISEDRKIEYISKWNTDLQLYNLSLVVVIRKIIYRYYHKTNKEKNNKKVLMDYIASKEFWYNRFLTVYSAFCKWQNNR